MKGKHIFLIILAILIIVAIVYRKKIMALFSSTTQTGGGTTTSAPTTRTSGQELTQDDIDCANAGSTGRIIENCTKPKYRAVGSAKQKSFRFCPEADCDLDLDTCISVIKTPDGKVWYFNYQSGDKCIYIDDTSYTY